MAYDRHLPGVESRALKRMIGGAPLAEILDTIARDAEALLPAARCTIELGAGTGVPEERPAPPDASPEDPTLRALAVPLLDEGRPIGTLTAWLAAAPPHAGDEAPLPQLLEQLASLASLASLAIVRKRTETQLLAANRLASVGTLAAGVAHEINNPLAFILGNISFLRARLADLATLPGGAALTRDMDEALADCGEGARRIESIVRDLRSFARGSDEQPAPVELRRVLEFAVRMVFNEVRHRARLRRDFERAPIALGDEGRLVQVVESLLINAAQAMPERASDENEVVISARAEEGEAVIEVRDNGVGVPPERLAGLFEPFSDARSSGPGASLGLAVSHHLVTAMNGRLTVESTPGEGSCFRVTLPLAPAAREAAAPSSPATPRAGISSGVGDGIALGIGGARRLRVLVIDDETLVGASIRRLVGQRYDVVHLEDARAALELCAREPFDAVLCDLMMPTVTGVEVHAELSRIRPELARRTGFITGASYAEGSRQLAGIDAGRFLEKPFNAEAVLALVERLVA